MLVKNTFGCSSVLGTVQTKRSLFKKYSGSSLDRKIEPKKEVNKAKEKEVEETEQVEKTRVMSSRTKTKIRKKLFAFAQLNKRLTFVTLTFVNVVPDQVAVKILGKFLDNYKKRLKNFQYLWVAERQEANKTFPDNIHFHMITNKYWDIQKTWSYWLELQLKHGIKPREENYRPSSAFDVKLVTTKNPKQVGSYLTKYITKNKAEFKCQVWNCSKSISALYTDFYTDFSFLEALQKLKGDEIKEIPLEFCTLHLVPLDKTTMRFYDRLEFKNKQTLQSLN